MKLPRWTHCLYAALMGYFWMPCPLCGRHFGGHEWAATVHFSNTKHGKGVCPSCADHARAINYQNHGMLETTLPSGCPLIVYGANRGGLDQMGKEWREAAEREKARLEAWITPTEPHDAEDG